MTLPPPECKVHTPPELAAAMIQALEFAAFQSIDDGFMDHAALISTAPIYRAAWEAYKRDSDLDKLIDGIARRYATDPAYAAKIKALARNAEVRQAIEEARTGRRVV